MARAVERAARVELGPDDWPVDDELAWRLLHASSGLWTYMARREQILIRRLAGEPPPWTTDPVLRDHRFLNVYREDDRVNQTITDWLLPQLRGALRTTVIVNLIAARHLNRDETIRALLPISRDRPGFKVSIHELEWHPYTTNYRTTVFVNLGSLDQRANTETALRGWWEAVQVLQVPQLETMRAASAWLKSLPGIGPFVGYMIACDLTYVEGLVPYDLNGDGWCYPHVGSRRALARMLDLPEEQVHVRDALPLLRVLWHMADVNLGRLGFPFRRGPLTLRHVEDATCEYHRYLKGSGGASRLRRYRPHVIQ